MKTLSPTLLLLFFLTFNVIVYAEPIDIKIIDSYMLQIVGDSPLSLNEKNQILLSNVNNQNYTSDGNRVYYQGTRGQTENPPLYTFRTLDPNSFMDKKHKPLSMSKLSTKNSFEMSTFEFDKNSEKVVAYQECWANGPSESKADQSLQNATIPVQCVMANHDICRLSNTIGDEFWEKGYRTILKTKAKEMADRLAREIPPRSIITKEGEEKILSGVQSNSFYLQNYRPNFTAKDDPHSLYDDVSSTALIRMKAFCAKLPFNSDNELTDSQKKH